MSKCLAMAGMALAAGLLMWLPARAEQRAVQLTEKDRKEIEELATSYGRALGLLHGGDARRCLRRPTATLPAARVARWSVATA